MTVQWVLPFFWVWLRAFGVWRPGLYPKICLCSTAVSAAPGCGADAGSIPAWGRERWKWQRPPKASLLGRRVMPNRFDGDAHLEPATAGEAWSAGSAINTSRTKNEPWRLGSVDVAIVGHGTLNPPFICWANGSCPKPSARGKVAPCYVSGSRLPSQKMTMPVESASYAVITLETAQYMVH